MQTPAHAPVQLEVKHGMGLPPRPQSCPPQLPEHSPTNGPIKNGNGGATWSIMNWVMTGGKSHRGTMGNAGNHVDLLSMINESTRSSTFGGHDGGGEQVTVMPVQVLLMVMAVVLLMNKMELREPMPKRGGRSAGRSRSLTTSLTLN